MHKLDQLVVIIRTTNRYMYVRCTGIIVFFILHCWKNNNYALLETVCICTCPSLSLMFVLIQNNFDFQTNLPKNIFLSLSFFPFFFLCAFLLFRILCMCAFVYSKRKNKILFAVVINYKQIHYSDYVHKYMHVCTRTFERNKRNKIPGSQKDKSEEGSRNTYYGRSKIMHGTALFLLLSTARSTNQVVVDCC